MLYIGTNYHPHDWPEERWKVDVQMMKEAGVNTVRIGHLCWDSFELEEGVYTFEWFDRILDLFAKDGIKVVVDISLRPAPIWVHKLCPGCNITSKSGKEMESLSRYMEDVADPGYQYYAFRFAKIMMERYRKHPALLSYALCNEVGAGMLSYSEHARRRFCVWLKKKYGTVEQLNRAWNTQRWCRKLTSFDEVALQENEVTVGAPEAWLDMKRYYSDTQIDFMTKFYNLAKATAPEITCCSNLYVDHPEMGYDYLRECDRFMEQPGMGHYPFYDVKDDRQQYFMTVMKHDLGELNRPLWFLEFQTGTEGVTAGPKDFTYMQMMLGLLNRSEMALAWTWRTMYGGKEQFYHGVLGHDGYPTVNYEDLKHLSADFAKLEQYAFPYVPKPQIGVAYSVESRWMTQYHKEQFRQNYVDNMLEVQKVFFENNLEYNYVNLRNLLNEYQLLIIPGHIVLEQSASDTVRKFVEKGGTVIMTGYSANTDGKGRAFTVPHPGTLADVFGIRVAGFYRTDMDCYYGEDAKLTTHHGKTRELLQVADEENEFWVNLDYYEELELQGAQCVAKYTGKNLCAVSVNTYGQGKAYYVAAESNHVILKWLVDRVIKDMEVGERFDLPYCVQGRKIAEGQYFYVNMNKYPVEIDLKQPGRGVLTEKEYEKTLILDGYQSELMISV